MDEYRTEIRAWLDVNCPQSIRGTGIVFAGGSKKPVRSDDFQTWFNRCLEKGLTAPTWPAVYGGAELDQDKATVLAQEMRAIRAPRPLSGMGLKSTHLPGIARGEVRWCQGYSEPGAGSDLAGLQTKAVDDTTHYIVNGSKIWTSGANVSDWIFCLVRTNSEVPKHEGISFLLFSMDSPGVDVKSIELISGGSEFCEVFFTDVRVPKENLLGEENKGWSIAKRLLQYERFTVTEPGASGFSLAIGGLSEIAKKYSGESEGAISDAQLRDQIIRNAMNASALHLTTQRIKEESSASDVVNVTTSILKYYSTEITCEEDELRIQAMGTHGLGWEGQGFSDWELSMGRKWLNNKAARIAGGTSEIQLNIIAKRVLGLPD
jgi:alkylation response protein AidB-like acyl-CoA dehydrogenase